MPDPIEHQWDTPRDQNPITAERVLIEWTRVKEVTRELRDPAEMHLKEQGVKNKAVSTNHSMIKWLTLWSPIQTIWSAITASQKTCMTRKWENWRNKRNWIRNLQEKWTREFKVNWKKRREEQKSRRESIMKLLRIRKRTRREKEPMREKINRERMSC